MNTALQGTYIQENQVLDDLETENNVEDGESTSTGQKKLAQEYFGVQSEKNIWWLAAFELPHETHDTLTWYFYHTSIPNVILEQNEGRNLPLMLNGTWQVT